jgi:hypothetical protein
MPSDGPNNAGKYLWPDGSLRPERPPPQKTVWERTPEARYLHDTAFRSLVDMMEAHMHAAHFTPSEMREAAILAAISFERRRIRHVHGYTMTNETARDCWAKIEELYAAIQKDERPFERSGE